MVKEFLTFLITRYNMKVELISKTVGLGDYKELSIPEIISAISRHGTIKEDGS